MKSKVKELIENKGVIGIKPRRISKIQDARRLLASYIYELQKGTVKGQDAKTMAYLLIKYAELYKVESLENIELRLSELESEMSRPHNLG